MEYSLVFHSSRKPQSVRCSFTSHSHTTENSIQNWNYINMKNNSVWRSNCPSVYLSPPPGLCSYCNWFPVRCIFLQITSTPFDCSHKTVHTLGCHRLLDRSSIKMDCLCSGYCHRKRGTLMNIILSTTRFMDKYKNNKGRESCNER